MTRVRMLRLASTLIVFALGCATARSPELRVVGTHAASHREVVFVQVTNPASRPMRLTRLQYVFAGASGTKVFEGDVAFEREVPAGQAIVVEVPLEQPLEAPGADRPTTLRGKLTAKLDEIVHTFTVSADIQ